MIELGKKQTLLVVKSVEFGVYLAEDMNADTKHQVLLPAKQVPAGKKDGDKIEVFIYKDSQDRLIATTNEPKLTVGEVGLLKVKQVTKIGAFLDWGLEKDILLPYHEQTTRIFEGQECLVAVYVDKSSRLCATMKVYPYLSKWIEKIPMLAGKIITWCLIIFMAADSLVSAAALMRQDQREKNIPASNVVQQWLDENYDDETLYKIYPKAKKPKKVDKSENITYSNTRNDAAL